MKPTTAYGRRVMTALAAAALTAGVLVPTASAAPRAVTAARENVVFTSVSNVLGLRHDTAKNAIGN
jgi:hypothetical protein